MLIMFAFAAQMVMGVFTHLTTQGDRFTGANYTSVHATIPVTFVMAALVAILGVVLASG